MTDRTKTHGETLHGPTPDESKSAAPKAYGAKSQRPKEYGAKSHRETAHGETARGEIAHGETAPVETVHVGKANGVRAAEQGEKRAEPMLRARNHFGAERIVRPDVSRVGADMNVTPLIDILLVLLVIFIAALPATQKGLDVNLPEAARPDQSPYDGEQVVVTVAADRSLTVNRREVSSGDLEGFLRDVFRSRRDKILYIIGDGALRYGDIVPVIDAARGAGVLQVGIVTDRMRQSRG